jgi:cysteine synthase
MPDWLSKERIDIIKSLSAGIILISKKQGGFLGSIERSLDMAVSESNIFLPRQFENGCNVEAHQKTTAPEIWEQLRNIDLTADAFVAGWEPVASSWAWANT